MHSLRFGLLRRVLSLSPALASRLARQVEHLAQVAVLSRQVLVVVGDELRANGLPVVLQVLNIPLVPGSIDTQ